MPVVIVDSEQAALMETAFAMLEAALTARVERADPDKVISNSLNLQALKLKTVRTLLLAPDPPTWSEMPESDRERLTQLFEQIPIARRKADRDALYQRLRGMVNAPGLPRA